jgi:hypothetical protein
MATGYERQSSFIDGDVILAEHGTAEFNHILEVFDKDEGHTHDGTEQGGGLVPLLKDPSGVNTFRLTPIGIESNVVLDEGDLTTNSANHLATQRSIKKYVDDSLDVISSDIVNASTNAASANAAALRAEEVLVSLGVPEYIIDTGTYTISDTVENADLVFQGSGTINLPNTLVKGRRFTIRMLSTVVDKVGVIVNNSFTIIGNRLTLDPGDGIEINPGELVVLEAISTTELEII